VIDMGDYHEVSRIHNLPLLASLALMGGP